MTDTLEDHYGTVCIGGRAITILRFSDDIDGLAGEDEELATLVLRLDEGSTAYGMEISAEKSKLMTTNTSGINAYIKVNGQKHETVTRCKYLGSVITDKGSKPGILSRIAQIMDPHSKVPKKNANLGNEVLPQDTTHLLHVTNEEVRAKIQQAIGPHEDLLTNVKRNKLQW